MTKRKEKVKPETYRKRREEFRSRMEEGVAVIPSAPQSQRTHDQHYSYWPDHDLFYLTGIDDPDTVAVLFKDHPEHEFVLFVQPRDPKAEVWSGRRLGPEGAREEYGADKAFSIKNLDNKLTDFLSGNPTVYLPLGRYDSFDDKFTTLLNKLRSGARSKKRPPVHFHDISEILHEMRMFKTPEEINMHRRAIEITWKGLLKAMKECRSGLFEYELAAMMDGEYRRRGAEGNAFNTIVAGGENATILHYVDLQDRLNTDELVLVDTGATFQYYCADISRTFPVDGKFTDAQRDVYREVLNCQKEIINMIEPGIPFNELQEKTVRLLTESMVKLNLLEGDPESLVEEVKERETEDNENGPVSYKKFFMHKIGHWLGIDVHDVGPYREYGTDEPGWTVLQPGMLLTVEPGLYISPDHDGVPDEYAGIGVRIEDDVLVSEEGCEVLSSQIPKEPDELESICDNGR